MIWGLNLLTSKVKHSRNWREMRLSLWKQHPKAGFPGICAACLMHASKLFITHAVVSCWGCNLWFGCLQCFCFFPSSIYSCHVYPSCLCFIWVPCFPVSCFVLSFIKPLAFRARGSITGGKIKTFPRSLIREESRCKQPPGMQFPPRGPS